MKNEDTQKDWLPCPHCGSTDLSSGFWSLDDEEVDAVECNNCYAGAPERVWNQRHNTFGLCKNCKHRNKLRRCENNEKIYENDVPDKGIKDDSLSYSYIEGGYFEVGDNFGCVHFTAKSHDKKPQ